MFQESLLDIILKGGYTIFVLLLASVWGLKVTIEKFVQFRSLAEKEIAAVHSTILEALSGGDLNGAYTAAALLKTRWLFFTVKSPLIPVIQFILKNTHETEEELEKRAYNRLDKELALLERGLGVLATLGGITPFVGLFGTVIGIIRAFTALSAKELNDYAGVMAGIAEALIATAAGLFVAIPAVIAYNYFSKQLKLSLPSLEEVLHSVIRTVKRQGHK